MPNMKTVVPYQGTPEQEEKLRQVIAAHKNQPGATMPVLQAAQEIFGYLPEEVQIMIAEGLEIPLSEVYGVATFYAQFTLNPKGKYQISLCMGTACYVKGAGDILTALEQKLGIKAEKEALVHAARDARLGGQDGNSFAPKRSEPLGGRLGNAEDGKFLLRERVSQHDRADRSAGDEQH